MFFGVKPQREKAGLQLYSHCSKTINMLLNHYEKEIEISKSQRRDKPQIREEVAKIQAWLNLFEVNHPGIATGTMIDGLFGPATERCVKNFQEFHDLRRTGIVTEELFERLTMPMKEAFEYKSSSSSLRDKIVDVAEKHLRQNPMELMINGESNSGPWVRSYMSGNNGSQWFWCVGFVQTILEQAFSEKQRSFITEFMDTFSCDNFAGKAIQQGRLKRNNEITRDKIRKGDVFLIKKWREEDWTHTGIITGVYDNIIETIEGNTNDAGYRNGIKVCKRVRNFKNSNIDVVRVV